MGNYYKELPEGYVETSSFNMKKRRTAIIINIVSVFVMLPIAFLLLKDRTVSVVLFGRFDLFMIVLSLLFLLCATIHELIHGIIYKFFISEKLEFGFNLFFAYCGVPNVYVSKKTSLYSCLSPFVIFSIVLGMLMLFTSNSTVYTMSAILFACHTGGCVGDFYLAYLLEKSPSDVLTKDDGPTMKIYNKQ